MDGNNNATEAIYGKIRERILNGAFPTQRKIKQNMLAQELGVSRTPVIKALHMLEADGLVDNIPQRGFFVHISSLTEIIELFMLRQSLEIVSAMYLAEYGTKQQFEELDGIFAQFGDAQSIDTEKYLEADRLFHKRMLNMCDNQLLHKLDDSMRIMDRSFMVGLLRPPAQTMSEHANIILALKSRDPVKASEATRMHTENTKRCLTQIRSRICEMGYDPDTMSLSEAVRQSQETTDG